MLKLCYGYREARRKWDFANTPLVAATALPRQYRDPLRASDAWSCAAVIPEQSIPNRLCERSWPPTTPDGKSMRFKVTRLQ